ncbi:hypothetical protein [Butyrivibrio proteoclasticus]|uniref:hypothetical protein n=1 Tax=Butyrivibrio proteoclasticus TaxID=43305 RepID=UPI00047E293D|nr:hypothetical protein [Butyrivibrio proteoclasticus]
MAEQSGKSNSSNGIKAIVIVGIVVIIALLTAILVVVLKNNNKTEPEQEKRAVVVNNEEAAEEVVEEMLNQEYVAPGYYEVTMTTDWHFTEGGAKSTDAYVENVQTNSNDVYFDLVLSEDESQVIYKSPVIPLGGKLEDVQLDRTMDPGTYSCVMIYHLVDENQNSLSELRVGLTIFVE